MVQDESLGVIPQLSCGVTPEAWTEDQIPDVDVRDGLGRFRTEDDEADAVLGTRFDGTRVEWRFRCRIEWSGDDRTCLGLSVRLRVG